MVTSDQLTAAVESLRDLSQTVITCGQTALALIETGQRWTTDGTLVMWILVPTEHDRAREVVTTRCRKTLRQLRTIRRQSLSPDAIRTMAHVEYILQCCQNCAETNASRLRSGGHFTCMAAGAPDDGSGAQYRFALGPTGDIIESH
jgi:hypothetical protein